MFPRPSCPLTSVFLLSTTFRSLSCEYYINYGWRIYNRGYSRASDKGGLKETWKVLIWCDFLEFPIKMDVIKCALNLNLCKLTKGGCFSQPLNWRLYFIYYNSFLN